MSNQLPLPLKLDSDNRFDRFFSGGNEAVLHRLRAVSGEHEAEGVWLFLHGPCGSGKTHLLQACAQEWMNHRGRALYVALGADAGWQPEALDGLLGVGLYCLDNIDAIAGDADWERALFNLLNRIRAEQANLIMTAGCAAGALGIALPDLRSRLTWGEQLSLSLPDEGSLDDLLTQRARQQGLDLDEKARRYLLQRLDRNPASLTGALTKIADYSLSARRRITLPLIRDVLAEGDST